MLKKIDLAGTWTAQVDTSGPSALPPEALALTGRNIDARVPGAIHVDLEAAGIIPDPFVDNNETTVAWVGRTDWLLERYLPVLPDVERFDLVFDGIDTVARIELNERPVGKSRNMHRAYRYDVTAEIGDRRTLEDNALAVHFTSAYTEAETWEKELGKRPNAYPQPFNFIRKMACSFGWDWGPTLVSAGLWRDVRVEAWGTARIASVRPLTDVVDEVGVLTAHIEVERTASGIDHELVVDVAVGQQTTSVQLASAETSVTVEMTVPDVMRWNPRGFGHPHLYDLSVSLRAADDMLDSRASRVGFRTVVVARETDDIGSSFVFQVNGKALFAKGVNWIPDSIYPGTMTVERYRHRLEQAVAANVNLVRVWGGGIYESDDFYDVCDELGLLVWQDFLFACAAYPEDEPLRGEVIAEARENVARLSSHPSLAIWCGNNENLWMRGDKDWAAQPGGDLSWGENIYLDWLPRIVSELDPARPYTEGSPWSGNWAHDPNDVNHQTFHSWDVWNADDYADYLNSAPRFVSEFGWQGAPAWRTMRDSITDSALEIDAPAVRHHQKAIDGHKKMSRNLARHFPVADSFDEWHYQTQWMQVDAVRTGVLHWRANWPATAGTILWQLNDLWPVTSWSAIDGAGRLKPLYFALKAMYRDRVVTMEPTVAGLEFCAMNDTDDPWVGNVVLQKMRNDGSVILKDTQAMSVAPRSVARISVPVGLAAFGDAEEVLLAQFNRERTFWFPPTTHTGRPISASEAASVKPVPGGFDVTISVDSLHRDVLVQADRIHPRATVDRGFTTIPAGESALFRVRSDVPLSRDMIDAPFVISFLDGATA